MYVLALVVVVLAITQLLLVLRASANRAVLLSPVPNARARRRHLNIASLEDLDIVQ